MGEGGDLGAYGAEEAVDQGGAAHVRDVGASPEEVRGVGGWERQRHGDARRRRGSEDFEGVSRAAEGKGSGAAELVSPFGGSE